MGNQLQNSERKQYLGFWMDGTGCPLKTLSIAKLKSLNTYHIKFSVSNLFYLHYVFKQKRAEATFLWRAYCYLAANHRTAHGKLTQMAYDHPVAKIANHITITLDNILSIKCIYFLRCVELQAGKLRATTSVLQQVYP